MPTPNSHSRASDDMVDIGITLSRERVRLRAVAKLHGIPWDERSGETLVPRWVRWALNAARYDTPRVARIVMHFKACPDALAAIDAAVRLYTPASYDAAGWPQYARDLIRAELERIEGNSPGGDRTHGEQDHG